MTRQIWLRSALALALLGTAGAASANTLTVSATVNGSCTVAAATIAFGAVTLAADRDADTNLLVRCNTGTGFNVLLGGGLNEQAGQRRMSNAGGTAFLSYNLFTNSTRTTAWGTSTQVPGTGAGLATDVAVPVYARIPAAANAAVPTGVYNDTVQITVTF